MCKLLEVIVQSGHIVDEQRGQRNEALREILIFRINRFVDQLFGSLIHNLSTSKNAFETFDSQMWEFAAILGLLFV